MSWWSVCEKGETSILNFKLTDVSSQCANEPGTYIIIATFNLFPQIHERDPRVEELRRRFRRRRGRVAERRRRRGRLRRRYQGRADPRNRDGLAEQRYFERDAHRTPTMRQLLLGQVEKIRVFQYRLRIDIEYLSQRRGRQQSELE